MSNDTNPMINTETLNELGSYIYDLDVEARDEAVKQWQRLCDGPLGIGWPLAGLIRRLIDVVKSREDEGLDDEDYGDPGTEECGYCGRVLGSLVDTNCPQCADDLEDAQIGFWADSIEPDISGNWMIEIIEGRSL